MKKLVKNKKSIDIDSEINGKGIPPVGKKDRVLDLTDEINLFLAGKIDRESIKRILLRMDGPVSKHDIDHSKIRVTRVSKDGYFMHISLKEKDRNYYMNPLMFVELLWFVQPVDKSRLRHKLSQAIYKWLQGQKLPFDFE